MLAFDAIVICSVPVPFVMEGAGVWSALAIIPESCCGLSVVFVCMSMLSPPLSVESRVIPRARYKLAKSSTNGTSIKNLEYLLLYMLGISNPIRTS
jgi:hypothetical protein